jgi:hypothetical protein
MCYFVILPCKLSSENIHFQKPFAKHIGRYMQLMQSMFVRIRKDCQTFITTTPKRVFSVGMLQVVDIRFDKDCIIQVF